MKIAFVCDDLSNHGNGTSVTAYRYANALRKLGHKVSLVGVGAHGKDSYPVKESNIPVVTPVSHSCGFHFGEPDNAVFAKAFRGADLVHLFLPFPLETAALKWARAHQIPVSAAFHLQPENVTYNARIGSCPPAAAGIYAYFKHMLYDDVKHIHCPSEMIAHELKQHGYKAKTHVISNGVPEIFHANLEPLELFGIDGRINILSVGRLAKEKDQTTIIQAIAKSKHKNHLSLHLAGKGYMAKHLMDVANYLGVSMSIGYYDEEALAELMRTCPLCVHASRADIEAISVIESFASGSIPIIAKSPKSAPSAFALGKHCLFSAGDVQGLAEAIDWWVVHPRAIVPTRDLYIQEAESLRLKKCAEKFIEMCKKAIIDDTVEYARNVPVTRRDVMEQVLANFGHAASTTRI